VLLEKLPDGGVVGPWEALKEPFESSRVHGPQQDAGVRANVLERVHHIFGDEDE
jgi:hypothetical protein